MVVPELAEKAFNRFVDDHYRELARLASLVTGDRAVADDLAADALAELRRRWDDLGVARTPIASARGVLITVAREWERTHRPPGRGAGSAGPDIRSALRQVPYRRRVCVVLRYAFGLSEREVADSLGISVGAVCRRTSRGAAQLAALLRMPAGNPLVPEPAPRALIRAGAAPEHGRHHREKH